jgi:hypothetical protein
MTVAFLKNARVFDLKAAPVAQTSLRDNHSSAGLVKMTAAGEFPCLRGSGNAVFAGDSRFIES